LFKNPVTLFFLPETLKFIRRADMYFCTLSPVFERAYVLRGYRQAIVGLRVAEVLRIVELRRVETV
jgi:hypothetical protein